jgi:hypothetical protein
MIDLIKGGNVNIGNVFVETANHFLFSLLDETSFFYNYKYISSSKLYPQYNIDPKTLDDYIQLGYCHFRMYKIQFDGLINNGINEIKISFPDYFRLVGLHDIDGKIYFKKKILKTKETFILEFSSLRLEKNVLVYIKESLPANYFIKYEIEHGILHIYQDNYICIAKEKTCHFLSSYTLLGA